jgi:hypothetical protein
VTDATHITTPKRQRLSCAVESARQTEAPFCSAVIMCRSPFHGGPRLAQISGALNAS